MRYLKSAVLMLPIPVLAILVLASNVHAQARRGTVQKPTSLNLDEKFFDASQLIVKFAEDTQVRLRESGLVDLGGAKLDGIQKLTTGVKITRLFSRSEQELDAERSQILKILPEGWDEPADLNLYYRFETKGVTEGTKLCAALNDLTLVETAFVDHRAGIATDPGDIPPTTPDFTSKQGYQGPAPTGIHTAVAHAIPGGRGEQLQVLDIETGLILDHEDVPLAILKNVIGTHYTSTDHGLAVAGEMVAARGAYGVTGGIYKARYKFHSHQGRNWASSVSVATKNSKAGDIIVLEVHLVHPTSRKYVPMEYRQDVFDAVRAATLLGIHVVAAAGNGSQNLDATVYAGIFDRTKRDSGAVLCGATNGSALAKAGFSNYGAIVDANGWGYQVTTTGYGALFYPNRDPRQKYTSTFSGTSSATPIVTSAVGAVLSAAKEQFGRILKPLEMRTLLRKHGSAVTGTIGVRPDLKKLMTAIGLPNGLELRNYKGTVGKSLTLDMIGPVNGVYAVLVAAQPASIQTPLGRLLLDPKSLIMVHASTFSSTGSASLTVPIPAQPALLYQDFYWQAARFDAKLANPDLTSSVVSFLDK